MVGLALARAGLHRFSPRAAWALVLSANAPDVDAVASAFGSAAYLDAHRHLTHSIAGLPAVALLVTGVLRLAARKPIDAKACFWLSAVGVASHLLLDWLNLYGIRLLAPFSERWLRLDWTFVMDPWMLAVLLLAATAPLLSRLVGSEIGERRRNRNAGRGVAIFALAFLVLYNGGRAVLHARAVSLLDSYLYRGAEPRHVAAFPTAFNPFHWRGLVEGDSFYALLEVDLNGRFDPSRGSFFAKAAGQEAFRRAGETRAFRSFLRFNPYPVWSLAASGEGDGSVRVQLVDLRFGTPRDPGFVATATVFPDGRVAEAQFRFGRPRPR